MNNLQVLEFKGSQVRSFVDEDEQTWFAGIDICNQLQYENANRTIKQILDEDERKLTYLSGTPASENEAGIQNRKVWVISESGLYHLIIKSSKPEAKEFRRWITNEVLPAIRKAGKYSTDEQKQRESDLQQLTKQMREIDTKIVDKKSEMKELKKQRDKYNKQRDDLIIGIQPELPFPKTDVGAIGQN